MSNAKHAASCSLAWSYDVDGVARSVYLTIGDFVDIIGQSDAVQDRWVDESLAMQTDWPRKLRLAIASVVRAVGCSCRAYFIVSALSCGCWLLLSLVVGFV